MCSDFLRMVREGGQHEQIALARREYLITVPFLEIVHVQSGGSKSSGPREHIKYFDIYRERPVRLTVRALIPVREHPKVIQVVGLFDTF